MRTDLFGNGPTPGNIDTFMKPDEVAAHIIDMIEKKDTMIINSVEINRRK